MTVDPSIQFRPAEPPDAAAIRDIVRAAYSRWVPVIGREPLPMRADYDKAVREHEFDIAVENGEIVGLIETMRHDDHIRMRMSLSRLRRRAGALAGFCWTAPSARRWKRVARSFAC